MVNIHLDILATIMVKIIEHGLGCNFVQLLAFRRNIRKKDLANLTAEICCYFLVTYC